MPETQRIIIRLVIKVCLLVFWAASQYANLHVGLADNGDWLRVANWTTSGPVGFEDIVIGHTHPLYMDRYFTYWLPEWNLDFSQSPYLLSSTSLLWLPGIVLNRIFHTPDILHLSWISILPRLLILLFMLKVFNWIDNHFAKPEIFYISLGLPLVLLTSTKDYLAYLNTFYQETGAIIGMLILIWTIWRFRWRKYSLCNSIFYMGALLFLALAKASLFLWPILTLPFTVLGKSPQKPRRFYFALALLSILTPLISLRLTITPEMQVVNGLNAIYTGILPFSQDPSQHLQALGLQGTEACIDNIDFFSAARAECITNHADKLTRVNSFRILLREPLIILRQFYHVATNMQQLHLSGFSYFAFNLGNYAPGDDSASDKAWANFWSLTKYRLFPRGGFFIAALLLFGGLFLTSWRPPSPNPGLSSLGFLLLTGLIMDMFIAINGDGKYELVKHLLFSNLLFDLALIIALNLLLMRLLPRMLSANPQPEDHKTTISATEKEVRINSPV